MSYNNASNSTCTNISNAATSRSSTKNKYRRKKLKRKLKKTSDLVIELFHRVEHLEALLVLNDKKAKTKFIISDEMKVYLHRGLRAIEASILQDTDKKGWDLEKSLKKETYNREILDAIIAMAMSGENGIVKDAFLTSPSSEYVKERYVRKYFKARFSHLKKTDKATPPGKVLKSKMNGRKDRTRKRRVATYNRCKHQFDDYVGKDILGFLKNNPMSDEEDYVDENGKQWIKRYRGSYRTHEANICIDRLDELYAASSRCELKVPRHSQIETRAQTLSAARIDNLPSWSVQTN